MHNTIPVPIYDDGYGLLWILRDSMSILGIIRARTWADAWEIAEDEMFPDADEDEDEEHFRKEYGFRVTYERTEGGGWERVETPDPGAWQDHPEWQENYGFRPNGGIYQKDLNGEWLDPLTPEIVEDLNLTLDIRDPEPEPEPPTRYHHWHLTRRPTRRRGAYVVAWGGHYGARSGTFVCHKRHLPAHSTY